jgi:hypothetical protein
MITDTKLKLTLAEQDSQTVNENEYFEGVSLLTLYLRLLTCEHV